MSKSTLRVRAVEGCSLPLEASSRRRVVGEMEVPNSAYYRRALRRGDIVLAAKTKTTKTKAVKTTAAKE